MLQIPCHPSFPWESSLKLTVILGKMGMIHGVHSHSEIKLQCFPVLSTQDLGTREIPTHKGEVPIHKGQLLCTYCVDTPIQMIL
jgi:hypothetical protein